MITYATTNKQNALKLLYQLINHCYTLEKRNLTDKYAILEDFH